MSSIYCRPAPCKRNNTKVFSFCSKTGGVGSDVTSGYVSVFQTRAAATTSDLWTKCLVDRRMLRICLSAARQHDMAYWYQNVHDLRVLIPSFLYCMMDNCWFVSIRAVAMTVQLNCMLNRNGIVLLRLLLFACSWDALCVFRSYNSKTYVVMECDIANSLLALIKFRFSR